MISLTLKREKNVSIDKSVDGKKQGKQEMRGYTLRKVNLHKGQISELYVHVYLYVRTV